MANEYLANLALAQIELPVDNNELLNERRPLSFEEKKEVKMGDENDTSTWMVV